MDAVWLWGSWLGGTVLLWDIFNITGIPINTLKGRLNSILISALPQLFPVMFFSPLHVHGGLCVRAWSQNFTGVLWVSAVCPQWPFPFCQMVKSWYVSQHNADSAERANGGDSMCYLSLPKRNASTDGSNSHFSPSMKSVMPAVSYSYWHILINLSSIHTKMATYCSCFGFGCSRCYCGEVVACLWCFNTGFSVIK